VETSGRVVGPSMSAAEREREGGDICPRWERRAVAGWLPAPASAPASDWAVASGTVTEHTHESDLFETNVPSSVLGQ
jgi:hypothetical protein